MLTGSIFAFMAAAGLPGGPDGTWTSPRQSPDGSSWVMLFESSQPLKWADAATLAENAGGALAMSRSTSMNSFLHGVASDADLRPCDGPWLGAQRNATATTTPLTENWKWVDGTEMTYAEWTGDQPNGSQWLTWSLRFDANPQVESTWAATWGAPEGGTPVHSLLASFPTPPDCDANGIPDALDILESPELDGDLDGTIDTCCPADLTGDAVVNIDDILHLLAVFNGPGGDLDGDGVTDVDDLLAVLNNFGCEPSRSG